jgi:hypothetical protein
MNCCAPTILPFTNTASLNIAYTLEMRSRHGSIPHVVVYHLDEGQYIRANIEIKIDGNPATAVRVNNGGAASGFVKIFK